MGWSEVLAGVLGRFRNTEKHYGHVLLCYSIIFTHGLANKVNVFHVKNSNKSISKMIIRLLDINIGFLVDSQH